jgi:uncharacterized protein YunC (DUF1805 family)
MVQMIEVSRLKVDDHTAVGLRVVLPDSPPLVALIGEKGFIMCGFINMEAAEKLGTTAAMVSGVKTCDDVLSAEVKATTSKAEMMGIKPGMKGDEAVKLLF